EDGAIFRFDPDAVGLEHPALARSWIGREDCGSGSGEVDETVDVVECVALPFRYKQEPARRKPDTKPIELAPQLHPTMGGDRLIQKTRLTFRHRRPQLTQTINPSVAKRFLVCSQPLLVASSKAGRGSSAISRYRGNADLTWG